MKLSAIAMLSAVAAVSARSWDYCACQVGTNSGINTQATRNVGNQGGYQVVKSGTTELNWQVGNGVQYPGIYVRSTNGRIDGTAFYRACHGQGAGDSTCFNCGRTTVNGQSVRCG